MAETRGAASSRDTTPIRSAAFGTQAYSHRHTAPRCSIGSGTTARDYLPTSSYVAPPYVGAPSDKFTTASREPPVNLKWGAMTSKLDCHLPDLPSRAPPGPGHYHPRSTGTVGQLQATGPSSSSPQYTWTRCSSRDASQSAYIGRGFERQNYGVHSPGPMSVGRSQCFSSVGQQASSLRQTSIRCVMAKSDRWRTATGDAIKLAYPGPGSYNP